MGLEDHPGFLGWTSRGAIAVHADWPAYAIEHGPAYSLERLGQFPEGTRFFAISDIDQCLLFRVGPARKGVDDFDASLFHIALWHEDLLELLAEGWIEGLTTITPRESALIERDKLLDRPIFLSDGTPILPRDPEDYDDEFASIPRVSQLGLVMTAAGRAELRGILAARRCHIPSELSFRTEPLISLALYDAAVRESCVLLESRLRRRDEAHLYGHVLIERYCDRIRPKLIGSHAKWLRTELRTCFKFVRNDFMHNLRELTELQCLAIVCRVAGVYQEVVGLESDLSSETL